MNSIKNSIITWKDETPFSAHFEDYYFNSDGGIEESRHVFVDSHAITAQFQRSPQAHFVINETGFGTGLNFYCTLEAIFNAHTTAPETILHFFSTELFPLTLTDFKKSVARFEQFAHITSQIIEQYPPAIKGFHRIILNRGQIYLTLMLDDSINALNRCTHKTDAWYLDGFSPSKNSAMWKSELFAQMARMSKPQQTSIATFTAAGFVRRGLQDAGFTVTKHTGFGKKREMITAIFNREAEQCANHKPWFEIKDTERDIQRIAIIGAGLAGCTSAEALARRGIKVTLFDADAQICQQASGNLQGALYAKLPSKPTIGGEFHLTGLEYSLRILSIYQCFDNQTAQQCGVLQLATSDKEVRQQQDLLQQDAYSSEVVHWVDASQASKLIGTDTPFSGLFFPRAGWVAPKAFCEKLIAVPNIDLKLNTSITRLSQLSDSRWKLHDSASEEYVFDAVIVANANSANTLEQFRDIESKGIRGQVTHASNNQNNNLQTVVCGAGYIPPALNNTYCFGASFNLQDNQTQLTQKDQQNNLANLHKVLPNLAKSFTGTEQLSGKVAYRCSTPDYLPMVGPAPIRAAYIEQYKKLNKDKNWRFEPAPAPNHIGLYLNIGHGSKGLITCPLSAEHLASIITNQPSPLPKDLSNALHPARFIIKQLIRRTI